MLAKIFIIFAIFVGSAVLLGSAAIAWGTVLRIVHKSAQMTSLMVPVHHAGGDITSLPHRWVVVSTNG